MYSYHYQDSSGNVQVFSRGKLVGHIKPRLNGFAYKPRKGNLWGLSFESIEAVQQHIAEHGLGVGIDGYYVKSREFDDLATLFLTLARAERKVTAVNELFPDDAYIVTEPVDRIANQRIRISGDVAFYQFSRTKMGNRTLRRTVLDLQWVGSTLQGKVKFKERVLTVIRIYDWGTWEAVDCNW
jgi:hypothetical protein